MPPGNGAIPTSAFLSYAHDSAGHREMVRRLWYFLNENGVDAWADLEAEDQRQDWPRQMEERLDASDYVLVIASPEYRRRVNRHAEDPNGRGVEYEAALIRDRLIENRTLWYPRILPVVLPGRNRSEIPRFLGPWSGTYYEVLSFTITGAEPLLRILTGQPGEPGPARGRPPLLPRPAAPAGSRSGIVDELIDQLCGLPALETAETRAEFVAMVQAFVTETIDINPGQDPSEFLRKLIDILAKQPTGLAPLAKVVQALHRSEPIGRSVRNTIERWEMTR
jgi:hypothetical protein